MCLFGCGLVVNSAPTRQSGLVPHRSLLLEGSDRAVKVDQQPTKRGLVALQAPTESRRSIGIKILLFYYGEIIKKWKKKGGKKEIRQQPIKDAQKFVTLESYSVGLS